MAENEFEVEATGIDIDSQPIELYKVLKIAQVVQGGGEAKAAISQGCVVVNGEVELRKRRKLYDGDWIAFNGEFFVLVCDTPRCDLIAEKVQVETGPMDNQHTPSTRGREKRQRKPKSDETTEKLKTGRPPIRF